MFKGYQKNTTPPAPAPAPAPAPPTPPTPPAPSSSLTPEWGVPVGTTSQEPNDTDGYFTRTTGFGVGGDLEENVVATRNVLNSDVKVVGVLRFTDDLLVDGSVQGEIESEGVLTVGVNAVIEAGSKNKVAVRTRSAIIHGQVTGDVVVSDRVELTSTAELLGDVTAAKISIQEGAVFNGYCKVGTPKAAPVEEPAPAPVKKVRGAKATTDNLLD